MDKRKSNAEMLNINLQTVIAGCMLISILSFVKKTYKATKNYYYEKNSKHRLAIIHLERV